MGVFALGGLPKDKPGPDGGIDGIIRYHRVGIEQPNRAVVSVKGGMRRRLWCTTSGSPEATKRCHGATGTAGRPCE